MCIFIHILVFIFYLTLYGILLICAFKKKCFHVEIMKFEPITVESLRNDKSYQKLMRKQQKHLESVRKRHQKERNAVQKQQCTAIEKLIKEKK